MFPVPRVLPASQMSSENLDYKNEGAAVGFGGEE